MRVFEFRSIGEVVPNAVFDDSDLNDGVIRMVVDGFLLRERGTGREVVMMRGGDGRLFDPSDNENVLPPRYVVHREYLTVEDGSERPNVFRRLMLHYSNETDSVSVRYGGILDRTFHPPSDGFGSWWKTLYLADLVYKQPESYGWVFNVFNINMTSDVVFSINEPVSRNTRAGRRRRNTVRQRFRAFDEIHLDIGSDGDDNDNDNDQTIACHYEGRQRDEHCFLSPIKEWLVGRMAKAKTEKTMMNISYQISKIDNDMKVYASGVDVESIQKICDRYRLRVVISSPFGDITKGVLSSDNADENMNMNGGDDIVWSEWGGERVWEAKSRVEKTFKFVNTRINHLETIGCGGSMRKTLTFADTGILCKSMVSEGVANADELLELRNRLVSEGKFCMYTVRESSGTGVGSMNTLYTSSKRYFVEDADPSYKLIDEFMFNDVSIVRSMIDGKLVPNVSMASFQLDDCTDNVYDPETAVVSCGLSKFVRESVHFPLSKLFPVGWGDKIDCLDMRKAYTQFSATKYYQGFVGKVTDFRPTDRIVDVGMYRICNIKTPPVFVDGVEREMSGEQWDLFDIVTNYMPLLADYNVYTSPVLQLFLDAGYMFDVIEGAWGSNVTFEFPSDMFKKTEDGKALYAVWAGMNVVYSNSLMYCFPSTEAYLEMLKSTYPCGDVFSRIDESLPYPHVMGSIRIPKSHNWHLSHITSFITGYMYINVVEQIMKMDRRRILFVNSDGIYFNRHDDVKGDVYVNRNAVHENYVDKYNGPDGDMLWKYSSRVESRLEHVVKSGLDMNCAFGNMSDVEHGSSRPMAMEDDDVVTMRGYRFVQSGVREFNNGDVLKDVVPHVENVMGRRKVMLNPIEEDESAVHVFNRCVKNDMVSAQLGPAGTGKSSSILMDKGFVRICFMTMSWALCRNVDDNPLYNNKMVEVKQCMGKQSNYERVKNICRSCSVLVVDEVSMMTEQDKNDIMDKFSALKIIFCGDPGYQLPPVVPVVQQVNDATMGACDPGEDVSPTSSFDMFTDDVLPDNLSSMKFGPYCGIPIYTFRHNWRYGQCPKLFDLCTTVRNMIGSEGNNGDGDDGVTPFATSRLCARINEFVMDNIPSSNVISFDDMVRMVRIEDSVIASRHVVKDIVTKVLAKKFVPDDNDTTSKRKYAIMSNNKFRRLFNGDIVVSNIPPTGVKCEERYCFTVHSFQGQTIDPQYKLFVDLNHMNYPQLIYTAITRVRSISQLFLFTTPIVTDNVENENESGEE